MTFTTMGAVLWLLSLLGVSASVIQPRDYPYDQIRFMHCSHVDVDDDHSYLQLGYYKWAPQPGNPGTVRDDLLDSGKRDTGGWNIGSSGTFKAESTGLEVELHTNRYQYSKEAFQSWLGTATYNGNGFNCFMDDKHAVHIDPNFGQCYTDLYCTHQDATKLEIFACKDTITLQQKGAFTTKYVLKAVEKQVHSGQCDESLVNVSGGGIVKFQCNGNSNGIDQLRKTLKGPLGDFDKSFKTETVQVCVAVCKPCQPPEPLCRDCGEKCHDEIRVTMPTYYTLQITTVPPPKAPTGNQPSLQAFLKASLNKVDGSDDTLCKALKPGSGFGALFAPVATIFGAATLVVTAACF